MKRIFITLAIFLGLYSLALATNPPATEAKLPSDFKSEISKHITYPNDLRKSSVEGVVTMRITLTENSNVKIVELSSTNPDLGDHVKKQLSDLCIKNTSLQSGNIYYMRVRFNLISGF